MANIKHVGRIAHNQRKVIVAYRVIPGDPENCLIVATESLSADEHDALIKAVESASGQSAYEFAEAMARNSLPDGRNMLAGFQKTGKFQKVPTKMVEMTPNTVTAVNLAELNQIMADQKGVTVNDLALKDEQGNTVPVKTSATDKPVDATALYTDSEPATQPAEDGILSDEDLAAQYRSQADALFKEAKALREQAEALVPTKKKSTKKTTESA
jgi:hypothetical protein